MQLVVADGDQPAGTRILASLEGGGHTLIRGAGEDDENQDRGANRQRPAQARWNERHYDSVSASPYFSIRE
jgi:hypothetical protein